MITKTRATITGALGLALGLACGQAGAQDKTDNTDTPDDNAVQAGARALRNTSDEAPLPDIDAIERGARPPASVSFAGLRPAASGSAEGSEQAAASAVDGLNSSGGVYGLSDEDSQAIQGLSSPVEHATSVPEFHTVKKGDTLWGLCGYYFNDPWRWPQLWSKNPSVTNPHWIFPGDTLRLRAGDEPSRSVAAQPSPGGQTTATAPSARAKLGDRSVGLRDMGFIASRDFAAAATITGSREEKIMLSNGDQAYLGFSKRSPLRAGERYSVFQADLDTPVRDPDSQEILGYVVHVLGDISVDQVADAETGRGTLLDLVEPVERGATISAYVQQFKQVEPRASGVSLEAHVVAAFAPRIMLVAENFVVLSRGARDGVQVGNRTFVIRRGDGYRRLLEHWETFDAKYPKEVVGELWIVDVQDRTSVAWIARTQKEIRVGETTEMRKGY